MVWPFKKKKEKEEIPGLGALPPIGEMAPETGMPEHPIPGMPERPEAFEEAAKEEAPGFERRAAPAPSYEPVTITKDLEVISSKLDALKAMLESINQRVANLEKHLEEKSKYTW